MTASFKRVERGPENTVGAIYWEAQCTGNYSINHRNNVLGSGGGALKVTLWTPTRWQYCFLTNMQIGGPSEGENKHSSETEKGEHLWISPQYWNRGWLEIMHQLRRTSRNTNDDIPSRIPCSLCREWAGMLGINGGEGRMLSGSGGATSKRGLIKCPNYDSTFLIWKGTRMQPSPVSLTIRNSYQPVT